MAEYKFAVCLMGAMDRLWFQNIVLFSSQTLSETHYKSSSESLTAPDLKDDDREEELESCEQCKKATRLERRRRSHSSSSSSSSSPWKQSRRRHSDSVPSMKTKLEKSMSCRDLELEELKGFMDLGFRFKEDKLNRRMMSVVPGLQRIAVSRNGDETEEEEEKMRPYLSEAWLIRRPDSPLLNLRLLRVYAGVDMKKHLRSWARTVPSAILHEC